MRERGKMSTGEPTEQKPNQVIHQVMSHWKSGKYQRAKMLKYMFLQNNVTSRNNLATGLALKGWCLVVVYILTDNPEWISKYVF
jgi:hypothetical protein